MNEQNYILIRAKRKSLRLMIRRDGTPVVYAPTRCAKSDIDEFVQKHLPKLLGIAVAREEKQSSVIFGDTDVPSLLYLGTRYPLLKSHGAFFTFTGKEFRCSDTMTRDSLLNVYREFLRQKTSALVSTYAKEYAEKAGLSYNGVTVKNIYSRFGSCSSKKNLNFSLALAAFDDTFIRDVVTHELSHLVHLNHSADFHAYHEAIFPDHEKITLGIRKEYSSYAVALCASK